MVALINNHPWLSLHCNIIRFRKEIEDLTNGSGVYAALTAERKPKMGLNPSFVVYDEQARPRAVRCTTRWTRRWARKEPLLLVISTQAADDFAPLSQLIDYGERINRKEIEDQAFHLTLYAAPADSDPWKAAAWRAANPALDDFRSLEDVKRLAKQAQRMPRKLVS